VSYCFNPLALAEPGDNGIPANVYPLGVCEGDCDNDSECGEGLVCFERDRFDLVPGCFGVGVFSKDYCIPGTKTVVPTEPEASLPPTDTAPTPSTGFFPFPGFALPPTDTAPTPSTGAFPFPGIGFPFP
jgi:hypothetical protein